jgi:hypothetical protein
MRKVLALGVLSLAIVSAACGGKGMPASPTSPSPAPSPGTLPTSNAVASITGTVTAASSTGVAFGPAAMGALTVQVVGTAVVSAVSPAGEFSLGSVPPGDVSIEVRGSGADAVVSVAGVLPGQSIQIKINVSGNVGRLDFDSRGGASGKQELEGLIESKTPPDMLVVHGQAVKVIAGTTEIRKGGTPMTYADLAVGFRVHVRGAMSGPGVTPPVLSADLIIVQDMGGTGETDVRGAVAAILSGSCSSLPLKFTVGTTKVSANSATVFTPACSALVVGAMVHADGTLQTDGSILASTVDIEAADVEVRGTVLAITGGTCGANNLAFSVTVANPAGTTQIKTNASTHYVKACSAVVAGAELHLSGTLQADKSVLAKNVVVDQGPPTGMMTDLKGTIAGLAGTCPLISFNLGSTLVKSDAMTEFKPSCSTLKNGDSVNARGMLLGGTLTANRIERK